MSWKPITLDELRRLGRRIDAEFVCADSDTELREKLNKNYPSDQWMMIRAPAWCGDKLVALVTKPRTE